MGFPSSARLKPAASEANSPSTVALVGPGVISHLSLKVPYGFDAKYTIITRELITIIKAVVPTAYITCPSTMKVLSDFSGGFTCESRGCQERAGQPHPRREQEVRQASLHQRLRGRWKM